jgi:hypothetical protein
MDSKGMIKMDIHRPNGKSFKCFFPTVEDLDNFRDLLETVVDKAVEKTRAQMKGEG